jgi:hypothetical protein
MGVDNPLSDWVPESVWGSVQALRELEDYASLPDDLVGSSKRWREWMELERPGGWGRPGLRLPGGLPRAVRHQHNIRGEFNLSPSQTLLKARLALTHRAQRTSPCLATGSACPSSSGCCCSARCAPTG